METPKGIALTQLVEEMGMEIWHRSGDFDSIRITTEDVNRCGLQLTGFYGYFDPRRIQIMGLVETTYLAGLPAEDRRESFQALM
jgi:HPr kinase/phosphorylase